MIKSTYLQRPCYTNPGSKDDLHWEHPEKPWHKPIAQYLSVGTFNLRWTGEVDPGNLEGQGEASGKVRIHI